MPSPSAVFGFILATIYGALFHLLVGGGVRRLALLMVSGWAGFALGHAVGLLVGLDVLKIGALRVLAATGGSWALMGIVYWLMGSEKHRQMG